MMPLSMMRMMTEWLQIPEVVIEKDQSKTDRNHRIRELDNSPNAIRGPESILGQRTHLTRGFH